MPGIKLADVVPLLLAVLRLLVDFIFRMFVKLEIKIISPLSTIYLRERSIVLKDSTQCSHTAELLESRCFCDTVSVP